MKHTKLLTVAASVCSLTVAMAGPALASDASLANATTGPDSSLKVTITNSFDTTTTNTNVVSIKNENVQQASTGNVVLADNTKVSGGASGNASNNNATTTKVSIGNQPTGGQGGTTGGGSGSAPGGSGAAGGGAGSTSGGNGPTGGHVLGASTGAGAGAGVAMLPVTGPSVPVDVSALRAAWQAPASAPTITMARHTQPISAMMLVVASVLSLIGAIGSLTFARRREGRV